jgi:hypothetical protein
MTIEETLPDIPIAPRRAHARWTVEEENELIKQLEVGCDFEEIIEYHGRSRTSIQSRIIKIYIDRSSGLTFLNLNGRGD